ncbi:unnamed protein product [Phaedon cochleariae]|uniref:Uncharacterized protein n=1 Tax=Phaedon cochleariae TaxID=80249 RepID=A0A9N9SAQ6_PHACE|nr:unnamed protein product [Phaedon cochleariae]
MGRKCSVPHCYTGYRQCKEKAALYKVPDDDFFLSKWQEAIARDDRPITPKDFVCEKHFKEEDILRRRIIKDVVEEYQRPKLKPDAIPSIFPDWPEFISKMTKKRRKMPVETDGVIDMTTNSDDEDNPETRRDAQHYSGDSEIELNNEEIEIKSEYEESMDITNRDNEEEEEDEDDTIGPKMYRCDQCKYKTQYAHNLRTHKTKHLSGNNAYMRCHLCVTYKTKWESVFINHMKTKHGICLTKAMRCIFCNFKTKVEQCLVRHCEMEHPGQVTPEKTSNYGYGAKSKNEYNTHIVQEHSEINPLNPIIVESGCHERDIMKGDVNAVEDRLQSVHHETHQGVPKGHKQIDKAEYSCSRCQFKTSTQILLQNHLFKHQFTQQNKSCLKKNVVSREFYCTKCSLSFNNEADLKRHLFSHRNENKKSVDESIKSLLGRKVNNNNENGMVKVPNFDVVTVKEDHTTDF